MDVTNAVSIQSTAGLVTAFQGPIQRGGPRRVEDVLMSNVREFKIELWDSRLERWVVPGHSSFRGYEDGGGNFYSVAGDYHMMRNMQYDSSVTAITYGPLQVPGVLAGVPHVFDTWHPQIVRDANLNFASELSETQAPYMPLKYYPPGRMIHLLGRLQLRCRRHLPSMIRRDVPRVGTNKGLLDSWGTGYAVGDVVFADNNLTPGWDADGIGVLTGSWMLPPFLSKVCILPIAVWDRRMVRTHQLAPRLARQATQFFPLGNHPVCGFWTTISCGKDFRIINL